VIETEPRRQERRKRVPLGGYRQKTQLSQQAMEYFKQRDEVPQWFCDRPGRLEEADEAGFRKVLRSEVPFQQIGAGDLSQREGVGGSAVTMVVGTHENGIPMLAYLMAQKREWFEEDRESRTRDSMQTVNAIREGKLSHVDAGPDARRPGADKSYQAGIKIDT
jgi:hypothetical protein